MAYSDIKDPSAHVNTIIYDFAGTPDDRVFTFDGNSDLQPDIFWQKRRDSTTYHILQDSSRGVTKYLHPNANAAEATYNNYLKSFNTNGITIGGGDSATNQGSGTGVIWAWKAGGGTTASNTDGNITSTVQANQEAGFSIVTYTGNTSNNQTVGHGLGAKPAFIIIRNRTRVEDWRVNHHSINNGISMIRLNSTDAYSNTATTLMNSAATSSVFNVSTDWSVNGNYPFVAYCWAPKQGYSHFGKYVGNGNADGPFVYTGFKPAILIMKETSSAGGNWVIFDNKRDPRNVTKHRLHPNTNAGDNTSRDYIDLYSNGFKMRNTDADHNQSGETMIYMAWAKSPFVAAGVPATAR